MIRFDHSMLTNLLLSLMPKVHPQRGKRGLVNLDRFLTQWVCANTAVLNQTLDVIDQ